MNSISDELKSAMSMQCIGRGVELCRCDWEAIEDGTKRGNLFVLKMRKVRPYDVIDMYMCFQQHVSNGQWKLEVNGWRSAHGIDKPSGSWI